MSFIQSSIEAYCDVHSDAESELLEALNRSTHANVLRPRMLSGHLQGRLLSMFSRMINPEFILEIGTYTGYSALCLAEGLTPNGKLITIDINEELDDFVKSFLRKSPKGAQIETRIGNALEILPNLTETFDIVFIDADKLNYLAYYDLCLPMVRPGGFIIADNVLWNGKVVEVKSQYDKSTQAILDFNRIVHEDARVFNLMLPIRDGLMVLQKL